MFKNFLKKSREKEKYLKNKNLDSIHMKTNKISVVIPAYNEEERLGPTLKKIGKYLKEHFEEHEIIVVDDGSTDNTREVALKYRRNRVRVLTNRPNRGKGYSVKRGILDAKHPLILFSDSDLATPIEEVEKFIQHIKKGYDIVIGSRNMKESNIVVKQPLYRQFMGRAFPFLVNLVTFLGFKDTQCGFKLFKKEAGKRIASRQQLDGFSFDVEMLLIAKKLNYKIKEAPVKWVDQEGSTVSPIKNAVKMFKDVLKIRMNSLKGEYKT